MSNRIINIENGGPNGSAPEPVKQPIQMQDLLDSAEADWKNGNKNKAFITLVGAMAFISQGVAQAMKASEAAMFIARKNCGHRYDAVGAPCSYCGQAQPKGEE